MALHFAEILMTRADRAVLGDQRFYHIIDRHKPLGLGAAYQVGIVRMSWPDLACSSAAPVSISLSPCEVMKSIFSSTFSLSAHSRQSLLSMSFAPGTQWSQNPTLSLPAAWALRTNGAVTAASARYYRERFEALTGRSLRQCPHCHTGTMVVIDSIMRPTVCLLVPDTS
jgi:hypothetical protein